MRSLVVEARGNGYVTSARQVVNKQVKSLARVGLPGEDPFERDRGVNHYLTQPRSLRSVSVLVSSGLGCSLAISLPNWARRRAASLGVLVRRPSAEVLRLHVVACFAIRCPR